MRVILKNNWFAPNAQRFKKSKPADHPVEIPDHLCKGLPESAVVVDDDYEPAPLPLAPETLSEAAAEQGLDLDRVSTELAAEKDKEAEDAAAAEKAAAFQAQLEAEQEDKQPKRGPGRPKKS